MKITKNELEILINKKVKKMLNESSITSVLTDRDLDIFIENIEKTIKKYFPKSNIDVFRVSKKWASYDMPDIQIRFTFEPKNMIQFDDMFSSMFPLFFKIIPAKNINGIDSRDITENNISLVPSNNINALKIKSVNKNRGLQLVRLKVRKVSGTTDKILKNIDKIFKTAHKMIKDNYNNLTDKNKLLVDKYLK